MKLILSFMVVMLVVLTNGHAETLEVTPEQKVVISQELDKEADSQLDDKAKLFLKKISDAFKNSTEISNIRVGCRNCTPEQKRFHFFKNLGQAFGKGASWVATTTAKPFVASAGFVTGLVEKKEKNAEIVALYQLFLNHQAEFDDLYLQAGTPEEMADLMILKADEIMKRKSLIIMKDFLAHIGVQKEIPEDLRDFELTEEDLSLIDPEKLNPSFINNHVEYKELRPIIGDMNQQMLDDLVVSGYFPAAISFENYKEALPKFHEMVLGVVAQIYIPKMALGIVSKSLAGLYAVPVILADITTGVSAAICSDPEIKAQFKTDQDLKMFCSYVINRSGYELMKSRAKGYLVGKKTRIKIDEKIKAYRDKRAAKKKAQEALVEESESNLH